MIGLLIIVPIVVGLSLFLLPRRSEIAAKIVAIVVSLGVLAGTFVLRDAPDESAPWFHQPFVANFHVGIGHGFGWWLTLLLALVTVCSLLAVSGPRSRDFIAHILILLGTMAGVFLARDLLLFALFWDAMLIPVFLIMLGSRHGHASSAWRYIVYNLSGGLALLLATAAYGITQGSTDVIGVSVSYGTDSPLGAYEGWLFAGFAIAFLVKTPVWPFHTWMPPTYSDLPAPAVAIVSAVQSKAGLYGFVAIAAALFPNAMAASAPYMMWLGLVGLLYGAFTALVQSDVKRVIAYSSLSHLGLIVIAIFSNNPVALAGAYVYAIGHGLFSAALFLTVGYIEAREGTRSLANLGGLGTRNPRLAGALSIASLAALGLPGLVGFAGEILILIGVYQAGFIWFAIAALVPIVLAAGYMLRMFQGMMQGPVVEALPQRRDLTWLEGLALAPLVLAIVWLGVNPSAISAQHDVTAVVGSVFHAR